MRQPLLRIACVLTCAVCMVWGTREAAAKDIFEMSLGTEIQLGKEAASLFEQHYVMSDDPILVAKVERMGRRLAANCGRPELPWEFHVVETAEVNACAFPGGIVYVFTGLLNALPSEDALAFIVAHEITHAARRHWAGQVKKGRKLEILDRVLGWGNILNIFLQPHYSRENEYEADRLGIETATKSGFSPHGGAQAMETLMEMFGTQKKGISIFRSHPPTPNRLKKLKELAEEAAASVKPLPDSGTQAPSPAASQEPSRVGDLQGLQVVMNTFYPLSIGAVWKYKATDAVGTEVKIEVRVQGELPGEVKGLYRVATKLPGGLVTTSLEATTAQAVLRRKSATDEHSPWEVWWPLTSSDGEAVTAGKYTFRVSNAPAVSVPFGEFPARKVEKMDAEGKVLATAWFAENLGLIKMEDLENSMTQVLIQYSAPGK